jgi:hypothetical protein
MSGDRIGSGPIDPTMHDLMNALAHALDVILNEDRREIGWVLMAFPFGEAAGRCNYISNAKREDIITLLTEQRAYFKGMPEVPHGRA